MGRHFSAFALLLAALAALAGCAAPGVRTQVAAAAQPLAHMDLASSTPDGRVTALLLAAEFALQHDDTATAAADYAQAAYLTDDPKVARRAVGLALRAGDAASAERLLERWQALGAGAGNMALAHARLALLHGDAGAAETQFRQLIATKGVAGWKETAAALLAASDPALAGKVLADLAVPAQLPADADVWVALSQLAEHLGHHALADTLANDAVQRFGDAGSIRWAASLRLVAGDAAGAEALYAKGVAKDPRDADLRLGYASLLAAQRKYSHALQVLARGPQTDATWATRVAIAAEANDTGTLRQLYADLQRAPSTARGHNAFLLGQLAEMLRQPQAALAWYAKVDPDGEHGFAAQARTIVLLGTSGKTAQAHALAERLQQDYADNPDHLRTAYELDAQLYIAANDDARAIAVYGRALTALPGDPTLTYDRGVTEANAGETDAALADFHAVLAHDPDNVDALNALGFTLADADRDLPEATRLLKRALAAKPDAASILDSWGWLQYRLGHLQVASTYLQRAWTQQRDPDIGVHFGEVLWKLGHHAQARSVFATVRQLDPANRSLHDAERRLQP